MVNGFYNKYFYLSNYFEIPVIYDGIRYENNEAAFQAQKEICKEDRKKYSILNPSEAKKTGRKAKLRPDWESVKEQIMYEICKNKFSQNQILRDQLARTEGILTEENTWNDTIWGTVKGVGQNKLGKILMQIRNEINSKTFYSGKKIEELTKWIQNYFIKNATPSTYAVVGISGGKDSTIAAALCVRALGADRVIGVKMPQGKQSDINYSNMAIKELGIKSYEINIAEPVRNILMSLDNEGLHSDQADINTPARIRMSVLYGVAACLGGRVVNTCNLSEDYVGYSTKFGDSAGDFSPLSDFTVSEVVEIGNCLGLSHELVYKVPSDGLCGKTDEDNLGFTYADLDKYIRTKGKDNCEISEDVIRKIDTLNKRNLHKLLPMPHFEYKP